MEDFINPLSSICVLVIVFSCLFSGLTWRALIERDDLCNEYGFLRRRLVWYAFSVTLWCLGIKFLFIITFQTLRLLLPESLSLAENMTWAVLAIYPFNILVLYGGVYWKLKRYASFSEIMPYFHLPMLGILPLISVWLVVFLIWNVMH